MSGARGGAVTFVGAGPGAADLLTLRGARTIAAADAVVWASSLVHPDVLQHARADAEVIDSAPLSLEDVLAVYERAAREGLRVARVHSGDPALWGAVQEQLDHCRELGLDAEIVPGVSAFSAVAAAAGRELTIPEVAQSVILTRIAGKTPMPAGEGMADLARHGTTMAVFLAAARSGRLREELLRGGYAPDTPVIVAHRVSWPDELIVGCTVDTLEDTVKARRLWKQTLFLVGPALDAGGTRSHLYHPGHFHGHRRADGTARRELRAHDGAAVSGAPARTHDGAAVPESPAAPPRAHDGLPAPAAHPRDSAGRPDRSARASAGERAGTPAPGESRPGEGGG